MSFKIDKPTIFANELDGLFLVVIVRGVQKILFLLPTKTDKYMEKNVIEDSDELISRRDALKKMGALAATAAISVSGVSALASCAPAAAGVDKKLKVLLINGSARRNGNTFTLLSEVAKQLKKNSVDSEIVSIGNRPVRGCIACGQCHAKQLGKCVFDDDVCDEIIDKMAECDAIIVGSPVYYGQPAGQLLAVMQRMCYSAGNKLQGKPASAVAVCPARCAVPDL